MFDDIESLKKRLHKISHDCPQELRQECYYSLYSALVNNKDNPIDTEQKKYFHAAYALAASNPETDIDMGVYERIQDLIWTKAGFESVYPYTDEEYEAFLEEWGFPKTEEEARDRELAYLRSRIEATSGRLEAAYQHLLNIRLGQETLDYVERAIFEEAYDMLDRKDNLTENEYLEFTDLLYEEDDFEYRAPATEAERLNAI